MATDSDKVRVNFGCEAPDTDAAPDTVRLAHDRVVAAKARLREATVAAEKAEVAYKATGLPIPAAGERYAAALRALDEATPESLAMRAREFRAANRQFEGIKRARDAAGEAWRGAMAAVEAAGDELAVARGALRDAAAGAPIGTTPRMNFIP